MISLATNQTLTADFTDIGLIIGPKTLAGTTEVDNVIDFSFLTIAVELNINDSKNVQIKALLVDEKDSKEFDLPINTIKKDIVDVEPLIHRFKFNIDANQAFQWRLDKAIDAIQIQVKAGTVGSTAGIITSLRYRLSYSQ